MRNLHLIVLGIFLSSIALANQLVEVNISGRNDALTLMSEGFDIAHFSGSSAEVVAWEGDIERLSALGLHYTVIHEDLEAFYQSRLNYELDDMGGYPTWSEIRTWYDGMLSNYPNILSAVDTVGYSLENRPIWAFKISDNPNVNEDETEVFLNAAIHAREVITPLVLMHFTEYLCENYGSDQEITELVNNREIWILPVVNPDGYVHNELSQPNGGGTWRKNKRRINNSLVGVDLNRNFTYMWGLDDVGSSPDPSDADYRGQSAGSEPETQAMMNFVIDHEFKIIVNYHSYSNLILYPYGHSHNAQPDDIEIYEILADSANATLNWNAGPAPNVLYLVNGDAVDWQEGACDYNTFSMVFEVGGVMDGFWPATSRIDPLCDEQIEPLMKLLRCAGAIEILARPTSPEIVLADTVYGNFDINWCNTDTVQENAPYSYDLIELRDPVTIDHVNPESNLNPWEFRGFSIVEDTVFSQPAAYYSGSGSYRTSSLISTQWYTVQANDSLTFQTWYSIEPNWDFAYVQVKTEGSNWESISGNITTDENINGRNFGNGITGSRREWIRGEFPLENFVGQTVKFRILYNTSWLVGEYGMVIDDISPVELFELENIISSGITDTTTTVTLPENFEFPARHWYKIRCTDDQGQFSNWSDAQSTIILEENSAFDENDDLGLPYKFGVSEFYPNPFNSFTGFSMTLPEKADVKVVAYNILGKEVAVIQNGRLNRGNHKFLFNASQLGSGIYFIKTNVSDQMSTTKKVVFIK